MIRVRYTDTKDPTTVAVCPACWNSRERREVLLIKLQKMGLETVYKGDTLQGFYNPGKPHAPGCPYAGKTLDPWKRFQQSIKKA
ncbi:MAG: hypothetical protein JW760_14515 [Spirochaetales bacterium]|nr:hypothetical protein [Spirochaetales bacterium]